MGGTTTISFQGGLGVIQKEFLWGSEIDSRSCQLDRLSLILEKTNIKNGYSIFGTNYLSRKNYNCVFGLKLSV